MKANMIIDQKSQQVKLILDWSVGTIGQHLTGDEAEKVTQMIEQATQEAGREAFQSWLMQHECHEDVTLIGGKTYRFQMVSEKKFLTKFGVITVPGGFFNKTTAVKFMCRWTLPGRCPVSLPHATFASACCS